MESKKALYKQRSRKGLADRGVRAKITEESRRSKRDNLLLSKRRIPLAAIQEEEKDSKSLKDKQLDRLDKLKEWKRQRELAKKEAEKKKAKPFVSGAINPNFQGQAAFNFGIDKSASGASSTVATPADKPTTTPALKPTLSSRAAGAAKNPSLPKEPNRSKWAPKPSVSQARKSASKQSVIHVARGPPRPKMRSSSRIAAAKQEDKPPASTRSAVSSAGTRRVATSGRKSSTKTSATATSVKSATVKSSVGASRLSATKAATREKPGSSKAIKKPTGPKKPAGTKKPTCSKKTLEQAPVDYKSDSSDSTTNSSPKVDPIGNTISPELRPSPMVRPNLSYVSVRPTSQVQNAALPFVNHPAWIPDAKVQAYNSDPNFAEAFGGSPFGTFSPFQFSGTSKPCRDTPKQPFAFTFRKSVNNTPSALLKQSLRATKLNMSRDSLADCSAIDSAPGTPSDYLAVRRSTLSARTVVREVNGSLIVEMVPDPEVELGMEPDAVSEPDPPAPGTPCDYMAVRRSIHNLSRLTLSARRVVREVNGSLIVEVVPDPEVELGDAVSEPDPPASAIEEQNQSDAHSSMEIPEQSATPCPSEEGEPGIDFAYFRSLHSAVTEKLTSLTQLWEGKSSTLEAAAAEEAVTEEVMGQIRTAVCQARLLMRQKLKQYLRLVEEAESQSGARPSTAEDLQGFWDMVYFQVEDIVRKFEALSELESNGWKQATKRPKTRKGKKRATATTSKSSAAAASGAENDRQRTAREKREAARSCLREMKAAAKRAREGEGDAADGGGPLIIELPMSPKSKKTKEDPEKQRRSAKRKSLRSTPSKYRRASVALIEFEESLQADSPAPPPTSFLPSSVFSPPLASSGRCTRDVPTAQLLSFTPGKASKTPLRTPVKGEGAFQRMYISITPSKRVRDLLDADVIMSPARRSLRLAGKGVKCATEKFTVSSIMEMPQGVDFAYCPNGALL